MRSGDVTKEKIKRSALKLFVAQGVDGTGVREIAKASGITEGAIYRHFKGKDQMVWELFNAHHTEYAQKINALQAEQLGISAKLDAIVRGFCRFYDEDETLMRFLLLVQHGQLAKVTLDAMTPVTVLRDVIQTAMDAGEIKAPHVVDATEASAWVLGILLQTATFKTYDRLSGPMELRADALVGACRGVLGLKGA